ncbi:GWxTD domain-containing protein, partial [candidate division KSB1 bacterium]
MTGGSEKNPSGTVYCRLLHLVLFCIIGLSFYTLLFPALSFSQPSGIFGTRDDYYIAGKIEKDSGNSSTALQLWLDGYNYLSANNRTDPRIGPEFIELVTEKRLVDLYEIASEIYLWGFSGSLNPDHYTEIKNEISMLSPLISEDEHLEWMTLLEDGDSRLFTRIREFWRRNDPIPASLENERLIEHWERIAYARDNFLKAKTTVYGTDDRGLIYVKYGLPDKMVKDTFGSFFKYIRSNRALLLIMEIREHPLNYNPEFELWIYDDLVDKDSLRFFFGLEEGHGDYGLRYGVEDFIPERAFYESSGRLFRSRQPLGYFLQYYYYYQLENVDDFFYYRLVDASGKARTSGRINTTRFINAAYDKNDPAKITAPPKSSKFDRTISPIDFRYFVSRFLDDENNPKLRITSYSLPRNHTDDDVLFHDLSDEHEYGLRHTLTVNDEEWRELSREDDYPSEKRCNVSFFELPQYDSTKVYQLSAVGNDFYPDTGQYITRPDTLYGILAGKNDFLELNPTLDTDQTQLELSDLMIGSELPGILEDRGLMLLQSGVVAKNEPMLLYIEAYHLFVDSQNLSRYTINYSIEREGIKGVMDKILKRSRITGVTSQTNEYSSLGR